MPSLIRVVAPRNFFVVSALAVVLLGALLQGCSSNSKQPADGDSPVPAKPAAGSGRAPARLLPAGNRHGSLQLCRPGRELGAVRRHGPSGGGRWSGCASAAGEAENRHQHHVGNATLDLRRSCAASPARSWQALRRRRIAASSSRSRSRRSRRRRSPPGLAASSCSAIKQQLTDPSSPRSEHPKDRAASTL